MNLLTRAILGVFALFVLTPLLNVVNLPHMIAGKVSTVTVVPEGTNCNDCAQCTAK